MTEVSKKYRIDSNVNYYANFSILTGILLTGIIILQIYKPTSLYFNIIFFFLLESFFFFKKQVTSVSIEGNIIMITYFRFLKKFSISSEISDVKISKSFQISYRSSSKKFTLTIVIDNKEFTINKLDNFDEDELIAFYSSFNSIIPADL